MLGRPWVWVAALAAAACLGWLPFIGRSLSPDEGGFLTVGSQWAPGSSLYGDYWVDRPPGLIAVFGLAESAGGVVALRLLAALAVMGTVLLSGLLGRLAAPPNRHGALASGSVAAILTATPLFGAGVVDGELLGLPFLVAGMAALVAAHSSGRPSSSFAWGLAAGAAGISAFLIKQSLVDVFVMALALLLTRARSWRVAAGLTIGATASLVIAVAGAAARGTDPGALWYAVVTFRLDATQVLVGSADSPASRFGELLLCLLLSGAPLLVAALGWATRKSPEPGPLDVPDLRTPAYAVLAVELAVVLLGGSYWLHYLMGLVPGVVLLGAAAAQRGRRASRTMLAAYGFAALSTLGVIGWLGIHPIDRPEEPVIAYLDRHAQAGESAVVVFGGANILRELDLDCPYPYLWSLPVRVRDPHLEVLTTVLAGPQRPEWVVVSYRSLGLWGLDFSHAQRALDAGYTVAADLGRFTVYHLAADG